jgi:hypothetical protein
MSLQAGGAQTISHVVWVVFENKTANLVLGSPTYDPYLGSLAQSCGLATDYSSTPYNASKLAMTSGTDWGVTGDAHTEPGPDIYSQLGTDWRQYMGGMTSNCQVGNNAAKTYYQRHNPATYYTDASSACATQDAPLPVDPTAIDLSAAFTWIEADVPESMHGCKKVCPKGTKSQLALGDEWAGQTLPAIFESPQYQDGSTIVFVVWDQGGKTISHTALIVVSPYISPGATTAVALTHYSLLKTTETYLGVPLLGEAGDVDTSSLVGLLGLPPATAGTLSLIR